MNSRCEHARLDIDRDTICDSFNRVPFGFTHNLNELGLFEAGALCALAAKYVPNIRDHYVAGGAIAPGAQFYSVADTGYLPHEALDRLQDGEYRVLLKRPEKYDARFCELLHALFKQVTELRGGLHGERVVRLESAILISSAATITPFHFDPEINFFAQIEGEKSYHVYPPSSLAEPELERFYIRGVVDIGQVALQDRDASSEYTFALRPGKGLHQPQNAAHWVETQAQRSVSYAFVFETNATRARGRTRACNYYLRKIGMTPATPGRRVAVDGLKATAMCAVIPARRVVRKLVEKVSKRF